MNLFTWFQARPAWAWQPGSGPPPVHVLNAAAEALQRPGARAAARRRQVLQQLADLTDPASRQQGWQRAAAAATALALHPGVLDAVAEAVMPDGSPTEEMVEAAAALIIRVAAVSAAAAAAVGDSALVGSLAALLEAPSTQVSPNSKLDVLECFRKIASRASTRAALEREHAAAAVVSTLRGAVEVGDWALAGEAAWALELMAGYSRSLTRAIREAGGVEAVLALLAAARAQEPEMRELLRDEEVAVAAHSALHALLVLLTDHRNRGRLLRAGGAQQLAAAFQDERLDWEGREQAATMLQELAAALEVEEAPPATPAAAAGAATPGGGPSGGAARLRLAQQHGQAAAVSQEEVWKATLLPAMVAVLLKRRGAAMQESKEAAAGVLLAYGSRGPRFASHVGQAGALAPLLQLLAAGLQLAGGERRAAVAALQALEPLAADPGCQKQLLEDCVRGSGPLDLLGLLRPALLAVAAAEEELPAYRPLSGGSGGGGGTWQVVAAGWHAALVAARLCGARQPRLQDAAVARGLLPPLARFVQAAAPLLPPLLGGTLGPAAAAGPHEAGLTSHAAAEAFAMSVRCEVAALLRHLSMRSAHHPALRACPGLLPSLAALLQPGAAVWAELREAARRVLINLGQLQDTYRPLSAYSPQQLAALLAAQGIEARGVVEQSVTGSQFVSMTDEQLRGLAPTGQQPRVQRLLAAHEVFSDIDDCGPRSGAVGLAKLQSWLEARGFRDAEVVPLAVSLMELMDGDRDDAVYLPDFLQCYDEFLARTNSDVQPASKRRRTGGFSFAG
ncbi:hypothetical protein D9Q98_007118 [Chlorella vulgaris]|uniref:Uncharacterized protein n=1 Tax=Chlorella vulgaris TaxID=3077 RepID=A0A9D4TJJ3_CHLVU|nr:hypothetical protein D9Q98_007118 [Chlorella vulgaris]